jgi:hypothetical protein
MKPSEIVFGSHTVPLRDCGYHSLPCLGHGGEATAALRFLCDPVQDLRQLRNQFAHGHTSLGLESPSVREAIGPKIAFTPASR